MNEQEYFVIGVDIKELQQGLKELTKDESNKIFAIIKNQLQLVLDNVITKKR